MCNFDKSNNLNVAELCLDAVCKQAYDQGFEDGSNCPEALCDAFTAGYAAATNDFENFLAEHTAVVDVIYHENKTVVKFADGSVSVVHYNPEYGYAYDSEKAIMAALLKHMCGNSYIKVLMEYGLNEYTNNSALNKCSCNVYNNTDDDLDDFVNYEYTPDGDVISMSADDYKLLHDMPEDLCECLYEDVCKEFEV